MLLLIDNYDSFTYNLYQLIGGLGIKVEVVRNDQVTLDQIKKVSPKAIVISPGPGEPSEAGLCLSIIQTFADSIPILGVCLGHQAIAMAFGGKVIQSPHIMHGRTSAITHHHSPLYKDIPSTFSVGRYHSLLVDETSLPDQLIIDAKSDDNLIMGIHHKKCPIYGVQFHPESVLSDYREQLMKNFLDEATAC